MQKNTDKISLYIKYIRYFPRVLHYLMPYRKMAFLSIFFIVFGALIDLIVPWPLKFLVDHVLANEPLPGFLTQSPLLQSRIADDKISLLITIVFGRIWDNLTAKFNRRIRKIYQYQN